MRRRAALSPEKRKELEETERHGELNPTIECIYCHNKNCVRTTSFSDHIGSPAYIFSEKNIRNNKAKLILFQETAAKHMIHDELTKTADFLNAHCMNCGSHWDMFDPSEKDNP